MVRPVTRRKVPATPELVRRVNKLYNKYRSIHAVSRSTFIPPDAVNRYVRRFREGIDVEEICREESWADFDRLTEEQLMQFTNEYLKHPPLWNKSIPPYYSTTTRSKSYKKLASALNIPPNIVTIITQKLRKMYIRYIKGNLGRRRTPQYLLILNEYIGKFYRSPQSSVKTALDVEALKRDMVQAKWQKGGPSTFIDVAWKFKISNCKLHVVWKRLVSVCMAKLDALRMSGDDPIAVALSASDWRVVDYVLLHFSSVKLITAESTQQYEQLRPLVTLFHLVQTFSSGNYVDWKKLHSAYLAQGRLMSVVGLQRRWHELKIASRHSLLSYWRAKQGADGDPEPPRQIYLSIVRRFPEIILEYLPSWQDLVCQKKVFNNLTMYTPKTKFDPKECEFDETCTITNEAAQPHNDNEDNDVVIVEKNIEIIDLDSYQEAEDLELLRAVGCDDNDFTFDSFNPEDAVTKVIMDDSDADEVNDKVKVKVEKDSDSDVELKALTEAITQEILGVNNDNETSEINNDESIVKIEVTEHGVALSSVCSEVNSGNSVLSSDGKFKDIIAEDTGQDGDISKYVQNIIDEFKVDEPSTSATVADTANAETGSEGADHESSNDSSPSENSNMFTITQCVSERTTSQDGAYNQETKVDPKLTMLPLVLLRKLDDIPTWRENSSNYNIDLQTANIEELTANIVHKDFIGRKRKHEENKVMNNPVINKEQIIRVSINPLEPPRKVLMTVKSDKIVYTPLILCKNPDFNTRLKRLTVSFLLQERNRKLLNKCRPLTIDLQKCDVVKQQSDVSKSSKDIDESKEIERESEDDDDCREVCDEKCEAVGRVTKKIELPDIHDVRRINKGILTAEVTPLNVSDTITKDYQSRKYRRVGHKYRPLHRLGFTAAGEPLMLTQTRMVSSQQVTVKPRKQASEGSEWWRPINERPVMTREDLDQTFLLIQEDRSTPQEPGKPGGRQYCCPARRHRSVIAARDRLGARAAKKVMGVDSGSTNYDTITPAEFTDHCPAHGGAECQCCCAPRRQGHAHSHTQLETQFNTDVAKMLGLSPEDVEEIVPSVLTPYQADPKSKKKRYKKRRRAVSNENSEVSDIETTNKDAALEEWIRQKNLASTKYGLKKPTNKPSNDTEPHTSNAQSTSVNNTDICVNQLEPKIKIVIPVANKVNEIETKTNANKDRTSENVVILTDSDIDSGDDNLLIDEKVDNDVDDRDGIGDDWNDDTKNVCKKVDKVVPVMNDSTGDKIEYSTPSSKYVTFKICDFSTKLEDFVARCKSDNPLPFLLMFGSTVYSKGPVCVVSRKMTSDIANASFDQLLCLGSYGESTIYKLDVPEEKVWKDGFKDNGDDCRFELKNGFSTKIYFAISNLSDVHAKIMSGEQLYLYTRKFRNPKTIIVQRVVKLNTVLLNISHAIHDLRHLVKALNALQRYERTNMTYTTSLDFYRAEPETDSADDVKIDRTDTAPKTVKSYAAPVKNVNKGPVAVKRVVGQGNVHVDDDMDSDDVSNNDNEDVNNGNEDVNNDVAFENKAKIEIGVSNDNIEVSHTALEENVHNDCHIENDNNLVSHDTSLHDNAENDNVSHDPTPNVIVKKELDDEDYSTEVSRNSIPDINVKDELVTENDNNDVSNEPTPDVHVKNESDVENDNIEIIHDSPPDDNVKNEIDVDFETVFVRSDLGVNNIGGEVYSENVTDSIIDVNEQVNAQSNKGSNRLENTSKTVPKGRSVTSYKTKNMRAEMVATSSFMQGSLFSDVGEFVSKLPVSTITELFVLQLPMLLYMVGDCIVVSEVPPDRPAKPTAFWSPGARPTVLSMQSLECSKQVISAPPRVTIHGKTYVKLNEIPLVYAQVYFSIPDLKAVYEHLTNGYPLHLYSTAMLKVAELKYRIVSVSKKIYLQCRNPVAQFALECLIHLFRCCSDSSILYDFDIDNNEDFVMNYKTIDTSNTANDVPQVQPSYNINVSVLSTPKRCMQITTKVAPVDKELLSAAIVKFKQTGRKKKNALAVQNNRLTKLRVIQPKICNDVTKKLPITRENVTLRKIPASEIPVAVKHNIPPVLVKNTSKVTQKNDDDVIEINSDSDDDNVSLKHLKSIKDKKLQTIRFVVTKGREQDFIKNLRKLQNTRPEEFKKISERITANSSPTKSVPQGKSLPTLIPKPSPTKIQILNKTTEPAASTSKIERPIFKPFKPNQCITGKSLLNRILKNNVEKSVLLKETASRLSQLSILNHMAEAAKSKLKQRVVAKTMFNIDDDDCDENSDSHTEHNDAVVDKHNDATVSEESNVNNDAITSQTDQSDELLLGL